MITPTGRYDLIQRTAAGHALTVARATEPVEATAAAMRLNARTGDRVVVWDTLTATALIDLPRCEPDDGVDPPF
jgi:hypothetical protein